MSQLAIHGLHQEEIYRMISDEYLFTKTGEFTDHQLNSVLLDCKAWDLLHMMLLKKVSIKLVFSVQWMDQKIISFMRMPTMMTTLKVAMATFNNQDNNHNSDPD